jgi:hypothetical protein
LDQALEEHPNTYDSSGNGEIEATVKQLTGLLRTHKLSLERAIGMQVPQSHPLMSWLVEYSAWIINVRVLGEDGLTAFQRVRGRAYGKRFVCFGEKVLVRIPPKSPEGAAAGALDPGWKDGIVLGFGALSHSYWVFAGGEMKLYRSVHRRPLVDRWDTSLLQRVTVSRQDLHKAREVRALPFEPAEVRPEEEGEQQGKRRAAKRVELRQRDFDPAMGGHGWSEHCITCERARHRGWKNRGTNGHSAACRHRLESRLSETEDGRRRLEAAKDRAVRFAEDAAAATARAQGEPEGAGATR